VLCLSQGGVSLARRSSPTTTRSKRMDAISSSTVSVHAKIKAFKRDSQHFLSQGLSLFVSIGEGVGRSWLMRKHESSQFARMLRSRLGKNLTLSLYTCVVSQMLRPVGMAGGTFPLVLLRLLNCWTWRRSIDVQHHDTKPKGWHDR
jgi:hypothetical protein